MASYTGGSKAFSRIQALEAERKKQQEDLERRKDRITAVSSEALTQATGSNFASRSETVEDLLKSDTVGLVSHEHFKARRKYLERCAAEEREKREAVQRVREAESRRLKLKKANHATLSFAESSDEDSDDEVVLGTTRPVQSKDVKTEEEDTEKSEEEEKDKISEVPKKKRKLGKNPDVNTEFLPDREREIAEQAERERLKQEWFNEQETIKNEVVRITYSYWDGSGHRKVIRCKKGTTVGRFLGIVQTQLKELRNTSADSLMFIKEDLIIPHHYSFYDFFVTKARGKSGPLFNFDVVEEVRLLADANKEKEDAHAAKVVERRWYERNRHIFPASRWEIYDPTKTYERYTIHGG